MLLRLIFELTAFQKIMIELLILIKVLDKDQLSLSQKARQPFETYLHHHRVSVAISKLNYLAGSWR